MHKKNTTQKLAFSLLELSIVLVIISGLMIAVIKGSDLISQARLAAAGQKTADSPVLKINGLVAWFEPTLANSFLDLETKDGTSISTWVNQISNTPNSPINATQSTAGNKPKYISNVINGLPSVQFIRANSNYMQVSSGFDGKTDVVTLFLVWQPTLDPSLEMDILEKWAGSGGYPYVLRSDTAYYLASYDGGNNPSIRSTTTRKFGIPHIISARKIKSGAMNIWVNGASEGGTTTDNSIASINNVNLFIGCRGNVTQCVDGYISEIIIFSRALSDQERKDVEQYLSDKYQITIS